MATGQFTQFPIDWQSIDASQIPYDHTTSGLAATDVQDAIDEVAQGGGGGGSVSPYTSNPAALGTANPGSSDKYSRGDHVHPKPSASDIGAIAAPSSPATGAFLVWSGSAWVAQTLATWVASSY